MKNSKSFDYIIIGAGSAGCVLANELSRDDPSKAPVARFNYLSDPFDLGELTEAVRRTRELVAQPAFNEFRDRELQPRVHVQSDSDIEQFIRATTTTDYHPSCSCRMGNDEMSVVDEEMRVHGIDRLRVVDASVMPDIVSGNLNAPVQMIALRAADFILGRDGLTPFRPRFRFDE